MSARLGERTRALLERMRDALGMGFWVVPAACVLAAVGLSAVASALDDRLPADARAWYLFRGGPEGARSLLETVAASMMTFTGLVFSVTILVLQQASNQFSPRVLRTFLSDRPSQASLGIFVGTFVYALLSLRHVRGSSESIELHVPSLTVWLGVALAVLCVGTFIGYIHHVSQSIRAVHLLHRIGDDTRRSLERLYPEGLGAEPSQSPARRPAGPPTRVLSSPHAPGVVVAVDEEQLWRLGCAADVTLALVPAVGDFVPQGAPLLEAWGAGAQGLDAEALAGCVRLGQERTLRQDTAFGLRELVDVAARALSPGINDPSTAVQALDQVHDVLRRLARRRLPAPARLDAQGQLRLWLPRPDWDAFVRLGVEEVRRSGERSVQVERRLRFLLEDLLAVAPASRHGVLHEQLGLLDAALARAFREAPERRLAERPSAQGQGPVRGD